MKIFLIKPSKSRKCEKTKTIIKEKDVFEFFVVTVGVSL